jgi:hypothetical protein
MAIPRVAGKVLNATATEIIGKTDLFGTMEEGEAATVRFLLASYRGILLVKGEDC